MQRENKRRDALQAAQKEAGQDDEFGYVEMVDENGQTTQRKVEKSLLDMTVRYPFILGFTILTDSCLFLCFYLSGPGEPLIPLCFVMLACMCLSHMRLFFYSPLSPTLRFLGFLPSFFHFIPILSVYKHYDNRKTLA